METGIHTILIYVCVYTCVHRYYIRVGKGVTFSKINVLFFFLSQTVSLESPKNLILLRQVSEKGIFSS